MGKAMARQRAMAYRRVQGDSLQTDRWYPGAKVDAAP